MSQTTEACGGARAKRPSTMSSLALLGKITQGYRDIIVLSWYLPSLSLHFFHLLFLLLSLSVCKTRNSYGVLTCIPPQSGHSIANHNSFNDKDLADHRNIQISLYCQYQVTMQRACFAWVPFSDLRLYLAPTNGSTCSIRRNANHGLGTTHWHIRGGRLLVVGILVMLMLT